MRVLLVKTSSMGDVIHALAAVEDACRALPGIRFDWVVEEAFAEIPTWHPAVERVIPVAVRRWRKSPRACWPEMQAFHALLREREYDLILDAQGLMKSGFMAWLGRGPRAGLSGDSAREPLASLFYQRPFPVTREAHAIERLRRLFSLALDYPLPTSPADYGLEGGQFPHPGLEAPWFVFHHATTWESKHWSLEQWRGLAGRVVALGRVVLPWVNEREREVAHAIAQGMGDRVMPLPKPLTLTQLAGLLAGARAVVSVDTGPAHLAAALGRPGVVLYGPTRPDRVGTVGAVQTHVRGKCDRLGCGLRKCGSRKTPDCFLFLNGEEVWQALCELIPCAGAGD